MFLQAEKMLVRNTKEMLKYETHQRYEMDMATIKADGIAEGLAEGMAKDRAENAINIAKKMFTRG